jgi:hypothetical protein
MNVCAVVSEFMLFPHNHVLTLGLPAFCSAAPTLLLVKLRSTWRCEGPGKAPLSGNLARFVERARSSCNYLLLLSKISFYFLKKFLFFFPLKIIIIQKFRSWTAAHIFGIDYVLGI